MQLVQTKVTFAIGWVLAMVFIGVAADITSAWGWTFIAGIALIPPVIMMGMWTEPPQTMSESIRNARS